MSALAWELGIFLRSLRNALFNCLIIMIFVLACGILQTSSSFYPNYLLGPGNFTNAYSAVSAYLFEDWKIKILAECGFLTKDEPLPYFCLSIRDLALDQIFLEGTETRVGVHYTIMEFSNPSDNRGKEIGRISAGRIFYRVNCERDSTCKDLVLSPWWGVVNMFLYRSSK